MAKHMRDSIAVAGRLKQNTVSSYLHILCWKKFMAGIISMLLDY